MTITRKKSAVVLIILIGCCALFTYFVHKSPVSFDTLTGMYINPISDVEVENTQDVERNPDVVQSAALLPESVINSVRKFVFFVGYARSGHSILGSLLDAHPNVIIAHEYALFEKWINHPQKHRNRRWLYTRLYNNSNRSYQRGPRKDKVNKKGYSLHIGSFWQGQYNHTIEVIGDKAGGMTTKAYARNLRNGKFVRAYNELLTTVKVPVIPIHAVRNPFDNIATMLLYNSGNVALKLQTSLEDPYNNPPLLEKQVRTYFSLVESVTKMIKELQLNVTEIHNADLIGNPNRTISRLCAALQIECTEEYLGVCSKKIFGSPSNTRHLVKWSPTLRQMVEQRIQKYEFLHRYSFDD